MGQFFEEIPEFLVAWIQNQKIFWVASAPLDAEGHVNISTKGYEGTFHIVNSRQVWYEDLTGSGIETISHLRENGRITVLFNAFEGPPRIARLFGKGTVYEFGTPEYDRLLPPEKRRPGSRAVIMIDVHKVGTSCGYAVPFFEFKRHRTQLLEFFDKRENSDLEGEVNGVCESTVSSGMKAYWALKNTKSIDGLTGLTTALTSTASHVNIGVPGKLSKTKLSNIIDAKVVAAFSLGVLASALFMTVVHH